MLSFFPRDVLAEILNLIESVSEGFPSTLSKKAHAAFDQGRGFERGRRGNSPSPLTAFF